MTIWDALKAFLAYLKGRRDQRDADVAAARQAEADRLAAVVENANRAEHDAASTPDAVQELKRQGFWQK